MLRRPPRAPSAVDPWKAEVDNINYIVSRNLASRRDEEILAAKTARQEFSDEEDDVPLRAPAPVLVPNEPFVAPADDIVMRLLVPSEQLFADSGVFNKPSTVIALPTGDLVIADTAGDRLVVVSPTERVVRSELTGGEGTPLKQPRGLACDATALYVSEVGGSRVRKMRLPDALRTHGAETPRGSHLGGLPLQAEKTVDGQLTFPQGLAVSSGELFITDCEDHRVAVYDSLTLIYKRGFGSYGEEEGELSFPYSCAVVGDEVVVCDVANSRLSLFHRVSGEFIRVIGGDGELVSNPRCVAIMPLQRAGPPARGATAVPSWSGSDAATALVVVEQKRIVLLSLAGSLLQAIDVDGAVDMWSACVVDSTVYVTDKGANMLHVLVPAGVSAPSSLTSSNYASAFASPVASRDGGSLRGSAAPSPSCPDPVTVNSPLSTRSRHPSFNYQNPSPPPTSGTSPLCSSSAHGSATTSPFAALRARASPAAGPRRAASIDGGLDVSDPETGASKALVEGLLAGNPFAAASGASPSTPPPPARGVASAIYRRLTISSNKSPGAPRSGGSSADAGSSSAEAKPKEPVRI